MTRRQQWLYVFLGLWLTGDGLMFTFHQTALGVCFALILLLVGAIELATNCSTGKTMSQWFVVLHEERPIQAWLLALLMLAGMGALVLHLLF